MKIKRTVALIEEFAQKAVELHLEREAVKNERSQKSQAYHLRAVSKPYHQLQFI